MSAHDLTNWV